MASTGLELAMVEHIRSIVITTQDLRATNLRQAEKIRRLTEDVYEKDLELKKANKILSAREDEVHKLRRENATLRKICKKTGPRRRSRSTYPPSVGFLNLVKLGCSCSLGCFIGMAEDDERVVRRNQ